jgi:hypothetical protein
MVRIAQLHMDKLNSLIGLDALESRTAEPMMAFSVSRTQEAVINFINN